MNDIIIRSPDGQVIGTFPAGTPYGEIQQRLSQQGQQPQPQPGGISREQFQQRWDAGAGLSPSAQQPTSAEIMPDGRVRTHTPTGVPGETLEQRAWDFRRQVGPSVSIDGSAHRFPLGTTMEEIQRWATGPHADAVLSLQGPYQGTNFATGPLQQVAQGITGFWPQVREYFGGLNSITQGRPWEEGAADQRQRAEQELELYARQSPGTATALNMAGNVIGAYGVGAGGRAALGPPRPTTAGIVTRTGAEGAAFGALHGAAGAEEGEGWQGALEGAIGGGVGGALGGGVFARPGRHAALEASSPGSAQYRQASQALYDYADSLGLSVHPMAAARGYVGMQAVFDRIGGPGSTPNTAGLMRDLSRQMAHYDPSQPLTLRRLEELRQIITNSAAMVGEPQIARQIRQAFDNFLDSLQPSDFATGAQYADEAMAALRDARLLWRQMSIASDVETAVTRARNAVGPERFSSVRMLDALRTEFRSLANDEGWMRTLSQDQQGAIRRFVQGGTFEALMEAAQRFDPGLTNTLLMSLLGGAGGFAASSTGAAGPNLGALLSAVPIAYSGAINAAGRAGASSGMSSGMAMQQALRARPPGMEQIPSASPGAYDRFAIVPAAGIAGALQGAPMLGNLLGW